MRFSRTIPLALLVSALIAGALENSMSTEMEAFLNRMPSDLQHRQAFAIRSALGGNFELLENLRISRRPDIVLPEGVDTLRVRNDVLLFSPSDNQQGEPLPLLIYLHGGGWTFGSINSCSRFCAAVAAKGLMVAAVDYPLAPEHSSSQILRSVDEVVDFIIENAPRWGSSANAVSLGGDSSGGNLALSCALRKGSMIKSLVVFYPVTDAQSAATSHSRYAKGYGNDSILMEAFRDAYLGIERKDELSPCISPALASDEQLSKLPPTLLIGAECDILAAQGAEFARRVSASGADIHYIMMEGTTHLFITVPGQPSAFGHAIKLTSDFLGKQHAGT